MKSKKIMAVALSATMVLGSSMMVFAEDANSATGTGTTFDHVDKEITSVTLPTASDVQDVFDYYVDPERLINDAGTLEDGTTSVAGNEDGVYFKNAGSGAGGSAAVDASVTAYSIDSTTTGLTITVPTTTAANLTYKTSVLDSAEGITTDGWYEGTDTTNPVAVTITADDGSTPPTPNSGDTITVSPYQAATPGNTGGYSSSSDEVEFEGKNSVDVDVSVEAKVTATAGDKDIALVADEDALKAATTPALLMMLKVGDDEKAITSDGATASAKIAGVPNNFAVTTESNKFVYKIHPDENNGGTALDPWDSTTVQLIGKTNTADVPEGANALTAPQIALTWSIAKHADASQTYLSANTVSISNKVLTLDMPDGVTVSSLVLNLNGTSTTLASGNHYTVSGTTLNIAKYAAGWSGGTITVTYSDAHVDTITCQ